MTWMPATSAGMTAGSHARQPCPTIPPIFFRPRRLAAACARYGEASAGRHCRSSACRAWRAPRPISSTLALALAGDPQRPRRVIALDYRGRGQSDYDRDPANYSFQTELADVLAVIDGARLSRRRCSSAPRAAASSTMLLGALRPSAHRRRRAQRYRPGDRAQGPDAHQGLCRQAAAAARASRKAPKSCAGCSAPSFPS